MQSRTFLSCFSRSKPVSARSRMQRLLGWSHLNAKHLGLCSGFLCIYTYEIIPEIIVVRRWTIHCACHSKWKNDSFKKSKKLKAAFFGSKLASPARSNSLEQMRLLVRLKLLLCYSQFCTTAKQSALTLSQAFCAMLPHRPTFALFWPSLVSARLCTCARNVIIPSPPHPNPPHCGHWRTTMIFCIHTYYDIDHILFLYVIMFVCVSQTVWSGLWTWI